MLRLGFEPTSRFAQVGQRFLRDEQRVYFEKLCSEKLGPPVGIFSSALVGQRGAGLGL